MRKSQVSGFNSFRVEECTPVVEGVLVMSLNFNEITVRVGRSERYKRSSSYRDKTRDYEIWLDERDRLHSVDRRDRRQSNDRYDKQDRYFNQEKYDYRDRYYDNRYNYDNRDRYNDRDRYDSRDRYNDKA